VEDVVFPFTLNLNFLNKISLGMACPNYDRFSFEILASRFSKVDPILLGFKKSFFCTFKISMAVLEVCM
jgi:hypothetical protein